ncbi:hypothetical protein Q8A73_001032 [Channa argus]|nr:hypothetical protein Q8A73_001032 [Channa argus]
MQTISVVTKVCGCYWACSVSAAVWRREGKVTSPGCAAASSARSGLPGFCTRSLLGGGVGASEGQQSAERKHETGRRCSAIDAPSDGTKPSSYVQTASRFQALGPSGFPCPGVCRRFDSSAGRDKLLEAGANDL